MPLGWIDWLIGIFGLSAWTSQGVEAGGEGRQGVEAGAGWDPEVSGCQYCNLKQPNTWSENANKQWSLVE